MVAIHDEQGNRHSCWETTFLFFLMGRYALHPRLHNAQSLVICGAAAVDKAMYSSGTSKADVSAIKKKPPCAIDAQAYLSDDSR